MHDEFLSYYERELSFIRRMTAEFSHTRPKIGSRLLLEEDKCDDPHMGRLMEAFSFTCARLHQRIDDRFPELSDQLLELTFPHFTRPRPAMAIVSFEPDTGTIPHSGYTLDTQTPLFSTPVDGIHCQFKTVYPVTLWPVEIYSAGLRETENPGTGTALAISIKLKTRNNLGLDEIGLSTLRIHINATQRQAFQIHQLLLNHARQIEYIAGNRHGTKRSIALPPSAIRPVGFTHAEAITPMAPGRFPGHRLLMEHFIFPEKFLFVDFTGLDALKPTGMDSLELRIHIDQEAKTGHRIDKHSFALNCTPVVNLYRHTCPPVSVEKKYSAYRLHPDDNPDTSEIFRIDDVVGTSPGRPDIHLSPLYGMAGRATEDHGLPDANWRTERQLSGRRGDRGTDVAIIFSDHLLKPVSPPVEQIIVHAECTNRDLPSRLETGNPHGELELETAAPVLRTVFLTRPKPVQRPAQGGRPHWQALSSLNPAFFSQVPGHEDSFKELLRLYDCDDSPVNRRMIEGISSIRTRRVTRRVENTFLRGVEITVGFDRDAYDEPGLYLFASMLEVFFSNLVTSNSFIQMTARIFPEGEVFRTWPPKRGLRTVL